MTPEQQAAYLFSQSSCALIEALGMQAENQLRAAKQEMPAYYGGDFERLITQYGISHNQAMDILRRQA